MIDFLLLSLAIIVAQVAGGAFFGLARPLRAPLRVVLTAVTAAATHFFFFNTYFSRAAAEIEAGGDEACGAFGMMALLVTGGGTLLCFVGWLIGGTFAVAVSAASETTDRHAARGSA